MNSKRSWCSRRAATVLIWNFSHFFFSWLSMIIDIYIYMCVCLYFKHHWWFQAPPIGVYTHMCVNAILNLSTHEMNVRTHTHCTWHRTEIFLIKTEPHGRAFGRCIHHFAEIKLWNSTQLLLNDFVRVFNPKPSVCWNDGNSDYYLLLTYKLTLNVAYFAKKK